MKSYSSDINSSSVGLSGNKLKMENTVLYGSSSYGDFSSIGCIVGLCADAENVYRIPSKQ